MHLIDLNFLGIPQTVAAFLLPTSDGPVLIETGPHSTLPQLQAGITAAGYQPTEVKHVLLTHIHLDHAGAAWWFAQQGARIYVHPRGVAHLADPSRLMASAKMIYHDQMDRLWGQMHPIDADQLVAVDDGEILYFGETALQAWHTPGHAVHHIAWQLDHKLFTGDVAGVKIGQGPVMPPCPPPDINLPDWQASLQRIRSLSISELWLTHFGCITEVENHLEALEKRLHDWAAWIKPHFEAGAEIADITPAFEAYVRGQLQAGGLDELELKKYEAANPAWMSVGGLMRYWKKATA